MRGVLWFAKLLYWLFMACLPVAMFDSGAAVKVLIGCQAQGECYAKGWWIAEQLKLWSLGSGLAIWPLVAWRLFHLARAWRTALVSRAG